MGQKVRDGTEEGIREWTTREREEQDGPARDASSGNGNETASPDEVSSTLADTPTSSMDTREGTTKINGPLPESVF